MATCLGVRLHSFSGDRLRTESPEDCGHDESLPRQFRQDFYNSLALLNKKIFAILKHLLSCRHQLFLWNIELVLLTNLLTY